MKGRFDRMKSNIKYYAIVWFCLIATYNVSVFVMRFALYDESIRFEKNFWIAWSFIIAAFICNLTCAFYVFKTNNFQKMFYRLPLITLSRTMLILMFLAGCIFMIVEQVPLWITTIFCMLIMTVNMVAIVSAIWTSDTVSRLDDSIAKSTEFIKNATMEAEVIFKSANDKTFSKECKLVYEALKYSDPVSNNLSLEIEEKIEVKLKQLGLMVATGGWDDVKNISDEIVKLIDERNQKIRMQK